MISNLFTTVPKEIVPSLHFTNYDVLGNDNLAKLERSRQLQKAIILGNAYHYKVNILFETQEGLNRVETTVWHATETEIVLKSGITIPVCCVKEVVI